MRVAALLGRDVIVPMVILAELCRGPQRNHWWIPASRETGITTRDMRAIAAGRVSFTRLESKLERTFQGVPRD